MEKEEWGREDGEKGDRWREEDKKKIVKFYYVDNNCI